MAPAPHATALLRQALRLRSSVVHHHRLRAVGQGVSLAVGAARFERSLHRRLHRDAQATLRRMAERSPVLGRRLHRAYAYAVFPCVSQASAILGSAYGLGELFEHGRLRGYAVAVRLTLGVQLGGQTFSEVLVFDGPGALARFKRGSVALAASSSAVLMKLGKVVSGGSRDGASVYVQSQGGFSLEAAFGVHAYAAGPAVLTRGRSAKLA